MLDREEYIEQRFFFQTLRQRIAEDIPLQDLFSSVSEEILATSRLPLAIDFLRSDLMLRGVLAPAMRQLRHYFAPFQTYVVEEAEDDRSRFDLRVGLEILEREAEYRAGNPTRAGLFLYQFEALCRNRLRYDPGLKAISEDPAYDEPWRTWILTVRRQVGIIDLADMIYVRSELYRDRQRERGSSRTCCPTSRSCLDKGREESPGHIAAKSPCGCWRHFSGSSAIPQSRDWLARRTIPT